MRAENVPGREKERGRARERNSQRDERESGATPTTRIRMTHGIIWVYVIREIRRGRRDVGDVFSVSLSLSLGVTASPRFNSEPVEDRGIILHLW